MNRTAIRSCVLVAGAACTPALGGIIAAGSPAELDGLMGTALLAVPGDGMPVGTVYGHPPSMTPGMPLATPIGPMGFMPGHERVGPGGVTSGAFHALPIGGPGGIAGSDVVPPAGATAIDFFLVAEPGSVHSFEITAVGSLTSETIVIPGVTSMMPVYVGFGAFGETIMDVSIVKLPFPTTTMTTWVVKDIRVVPTPGSAALAACGVLLAVRRRRGRAG